MTEEKTIEETNNILLNIINSPKKLIRNNTEHLNKTEFIEIDNITELNKLYSAKVIEELTEIQLANFQDINEFVDLYQLVFSFARLNGFTAEQIKDAIIAKTEKRGTFGKIALFLHRDEDKEKPQHQIYFSEEFINS